MAEAEETSSILRIIRDLRERQREKFDIQAKDFRSAVEEINKAYNPKAMTPDCKRILLDYNSASLRYAYLVKYPIHVSALQYFLSRNTEHIKSILGDRDTIKVCSLGGGPGSDVVGFADEICKLPELSEKTYKFTVIDNMGGWEVVFNDLFQVADAKKHGNLGKFLTSEKVSHSFICDDLSSPKDEALEEIRSADISILMKFVSALHPNTALIDIKKLFSCMKPGALAVFLDNSGGGSQYVANKAACQCNFEQIGWSTDHEIFEKPEFDEEQCGIPGRNGIAVAMKMWKKSENPQRPELTEKKLP